MTGRKALYFGSKVTIGIEGWDDDQARDYLRDLEAKATPDAFRYAPPEAGRCRPLGQPAVLHAGRPTPPPIAAACTAPPSRIQPIVEPRRPPGAMPLKTTPLHDHFGVEVHDVDLSALDDATFARILDAFFAHGALLFRDQDLQPGAVALGKRFGIPSIPPSQFNLPDHPEVSVPAT